MARPGTWDLDLDGDFRVADGWEYVTLRQQSSAGAYADVVPVDPAGVFALREVMNKRTVAGQMEAADVVWHLDAADLPAGVEPRGGDRVRDAAGVEWLVGQPTLAGASDQWRVPCLRVVSATT